MDNHPYRIDDIYNACYLLIELNEYKNTFPKPYHIVITIEYLLRYENKLSLKIVT